jgi:hypothetical protein
MKNLNSIVYIYSVERESATGIDKWINESSGKSLKKTKIGQTKTTLKALYSSKVGGIANYISYTPWIGDDGKPVTDESGNQLTLQDKEEQFWNKPKGYFNNNPRTREDNDNKTPLTYWQRSEWKFNDGATMLDLSNMDERMCYYMCLASKRVANSEKELRDHKWPYAEFYIAIENESDEMQYNKNSRKIEAFASLRSKSMTPVMRRKIADILEITKPQASLSEETVVNSLYRFIDTSDFRRNSNLEKLLGLYHKLSTATGREEIEARHILIRALDARVIYHKAGTYTWIRPEGKLVIGEKHSEAIDFLLNPKKEDLVEDIIKQIEARTV